MDVASYTPVGHVSTKKGLELDMRNVTFVDTPGQDIFYRMRNYGASVADLGLLVLAVDEGVNI